MNKMQFINNDISIFLDLYGNLYLEYDKSISQVIIGKEDTIELIEYDYCVTECEDHMINNVNINFMKEEKEEIEEEDSDDDSDNEYIYEDIESKYGYQNKPFHFSNTGFDIPIKYVVDEEISAPYDSIIYKSDCACFKSENPEDNYYELKVYDDGRISFCALGSKEKNYMLEIKDNQILLNKP